MSWIGKIMDLLSLSVFDIPKIPAILKKEVQLKREEAPTETVEGEKPKEAEAPEIKPKPEEPRKESLLEQIPKRTHGLPENSELLSDGWDTIPSKPPSQPKAYTYELPSEEELGVSQGVIKTEPVNPPEVVGIPPEAYAGRVAVTVRQPDGQVKTYYVYGKMIEQEIKGFQASGCEILGIARVG